MERKKILIVEDHKESADAIADFVRFVFPDWDIRRASTGREAIAQALEDPADVMILDIALADEVNGLDVIQRLWEKGIDGKPRIIVTTAMGNRAFRGPRTGRPWMEQLNEPQRALVSGFFEKPFRWQEFLTAVAQAAGIPPPETIKLISDSE